MAAIQGTPFSKFTVEFECDFESLRYIYHPRAIAVVSVGIRVAGTRENPSIIEHFASTSSSLVRCNVCYVVKEAIIWFGLFEFQFQDIRVTEKRIRHTLAAESLNFLSIFAVVGLEFGNVYLYTF